VLFLTLTLTANSSYFLLLSSFAGDATYQDKLLLIIFPVGDTINHQ
jgi:hypothetical protein